MDGATHCSRFIVLPLAKSRGLEWLTPRDLNGLLAPQAAISQPRDKSRWRGCPSFRRRQPTGALPPMSFVQSKLSQTDPQHRRSMSAARARQNVAIKVRHVLSIAKVRVALLTRSPLRQCCLGFYRALVIPLDIAIASGGPSQNGGQVA